MPVARVSINQTIGGAVINNVLGYGSTVAWTSSECGLMADAIANSWADAIKVVQSDAVAYTDFTYRDLIDATIGGAGALIQTGGLGQPSVPTFAAVKVALGTPLAGRAYRGRTGIAGAPENQTDASDPNKLTGSYRDDVQDALIAFATDVGTALAAIQPEAYVAVVSTVLDGALRVPPIATPVSSLTAMARLGTRVSRLS